MLTKTQKAIMYSISFVTLFLSIIASIPFRTLTFINGNESILVIENVIKFVAFPIVVLGLVVYPNLLKYSQINKKEERSKVVNILSYMPIIVYSISLLSFALHTLTFKLVPMAVNAHSILIVMIVSYIAILVCLIPVMNKMTMNFPKKGNIILDASAGCAYIVFIILAWRIIVTYNESFSVADGFIYGESNSDPFLFALLVLLAVGLVVFMYKIFALIKKDEVIVYVQDQSEDDLDNVVSEEYNNAYNDVLDDYEQYFEEGLDDADTYEDFDSESEVEDDEVEELVGEDATNLNETEDVSHEVETKEVVQTVDMTEIDKDIDEFHEKKRKAIEEMEELNSILIKTDNMNDELVLAKVEELKAEIENQKQLLAEEREEYEKLSEAYQNEIQALSARCQEIDELEKPVVVEEVKTVKKKVVKPALEAVLEAVDALKEENWVVKGEIKDGSGTMKFIKDRLLFLIIQGTSSDYRITFLTTEKKWDSFYHMNKYMDVPKKDMGSDNWLKFTNKPNSGITLGNIKSMIRESVKGADEQLEIRRKEAEELKLQKALAKKAAREAAKQAEETK